MAMGKKSEGGRYSAASRTTWPLDVGKRPTALSRADQIGDLGVAYAPARA